MFFVCEKDLGFAKPVINLNHPNPTSFKHLLMKDQIPSMEERLDGGPKLQNLDPVSDQRSKGYRFTETLNGKNIRE